MELTREGLSHQRRAEKIFNWNVSHVYPCTKELQPLLDWNDLLLGLLCNIKEMSSKMFHNLLSHKDEEDKDPCVHSSGTSAETGMFDELFCCPACDDIMVALFRMILKTGNFFPQQI